MRDETYQSPNQLNIAATCIGTKALGPGWRSVVWVQGCLLHCQGCIAPEWIPQIAARIVDPQDLASELLRDKRIDGITLSGGEPMLQARGLYALVQRIKSMRDVNVICFTGYRYENLLRLPASSGIRLLLSEIDLLIDGPYIQSLNRNIGLRGSDNQRFIHLTEKLKDFSFEEQKRGVEIRITDGQYLMVGVPPSNAISEIDTVIDRAIQTAMKRGGYVRP